MGRSVTAAAAQATLPICAEILVCPDDRTLAQATLPICAEILVCPDDRTLEDYLALAWIGTRDLPVEAKPMPKQQVWKQRQAIL